jgi:hypothetical protein
MFTPSERERIRSEIVDVAKRDPRISGGAITGSASVDRLDRWSDIDLAFGVNVDQLRDTLNDFTQLMYRDYGVLHHLDVVSGTWIYRVFFLSNTLQVDLAFAPEKDFGARASTFKLVFGTASRSTHDPLTPSETLIGWAWLYALHARSCIEREHTWRAEYMISGMRDQVISLCCLRHNLPERQGRGVDRLPDELKSRLEEGLVKSLLEDELRRAFGAVTQLFLDEIELLDSSLSSRLKPALVELANRTH